jgi:hypothetical protein
LGAKPIERDFSMFNLNFDTDNAAFNEHPGAMREEIARILKRLAQKIENGETPHKIFDINGNKIGEIDFDEQEEEE